MFPLAEPSCATGVYRSPLRDSPVGPRFGRHHPLIRGLRKGHAAAESRAANRPGSFSRSAGIYGITPLSNAICCTSRGMLGGSTRKPFSSAARADPPPDVNGAHPRPRLMPKGAEKRRQPPLEIGLPPLFQGPVSEPRKRPTPRKSAKIALQSVSRRAQAGQFRPQVSPAQKVYPMEQGSSLLSMTGFDWRICAFKARDSQRSNPNAHFRDYNDGRMPAHVHLLSSAAA